MAKETKSISPGDELIRFADGTGLMVAPITGEATLWSAGETSSRLFDVPADEDTSAEFRRALDALGISQQLSLHLDMEGFSGQPGYGAAGRKQTVLLRPPPSGVAPSVQVVLFQDESGGLSWHFPDGFFEGAQDGKPGNIQFTISTRILAAQEAIQKGRPFPLPPQGPITKQGRNVFKVLVIPTAGMDNIVARLEEKQHGHFLRSVSADDYRERRGAAFTDWRWLAGNRSLLVMHDLFSSVSGMLSGMPASAVAMLHDAYSGRVIGFDHPTASRTPEQSARSLIEALNGAVPDGELEFDVLAHGRGGIVARTLAERGRQLGGVRLRVRKIFMAGSPNLGTPLADPERLPDLLNVLTNLHADFAEGPALYPLQLLLAAVAQLAHDPRTVLPGIAAMATGGYVSEVLNSAEPPAETDYACVIADFQPDPALDNAFFTSAFRSEVVEPVFAAGNTRAQNDLLVPAETFVADPWSCLARNVLAYKPSEHVSHTAYFGMPKTFEMMSAHFGLHTQTLNPSPAASVRGLLGLRRSALEAAPGPPGEGRFRFIDMDEDAHEGPIMKGLSDVRLRGGTATGEPGGEDEGLLVGRSRRGARGTEVFRTVGGTPTPAEKRFDPGNIAALSSEQPRWPTWNQSGPSTPSTAPPQSTSAAGEVTLQRTPHISMPASVTEGEKLDVTVSLKAWSSGGSATGPVNVVIPAAEEEVAVTVRLEAVGFEFTDGEASKTIRVRRGAARADESATFRLKALSPGRLPAQRRIVADFWHNNATIGWVGGDIVISPAPAETQPPPVARFTPPERNRTPCDLSLLVDGSSELLATFRDVYQFKSMGQFKFDSNGLAEMIQGYISPHLYTFPENGSPAELMTWRSDFNAKLVTLGGVLWMMLPERFRREYFRLRETEDLASIWVHSEDLVFPWELVRPFQEGGEPQLTLGQMHVLGRWLRQLDLLPSPQQMRVEKVAVMNPKYQDASLALPWSGDEADKLRTFFQRKVIPMTTVSEENVKRFVLDATDIQLLHFTGHGDANAANSDLSSLMLEDRQLLAASLGQTRVGPHAHPFMVLNACSVGVVNVVVERAAGFPATCLRGGFSGLIAPLWPVPDRSAMDFSLRLYKLLLNKRSVGEALCELRREEPKDPTYQAYTFFGDPWARLLFL